MNKGRMEEDRLDDGARVGNNDTVTVQGENQVRKPQMPHERDESTHSQAADSPSARRMGEIAHDSATSGQQDTDKGPPLDDAYEKQKGGEEKQRRQ